MKRTLPKPYLTGLHDHHFLHVLHRCYFRSRLFQLLNLLHCCHFRRLLTYFSCLGSRLIRKDRFIDLGSQPYRLGRSWDQLWFQMVASSLVLTHFSCLGRPRDRRSHHCCWIEEVDSFLLISILGGESGDIKKCIIAARRWLVYWPISAGDDQYIEISM